MSQWTVSGQTVLITGASSGIGTAYAEEFAKRKANLILVARSGAVLRQLAGSLREQHGIEAKVLELDLSLPESAQKLFDQFPKIDGLINNAGFATWGNFAEQDAKGRERTSEEVRLNCSTVVDLTQHYLPHMVAQKRGFVVNVASTAAFQPMPKMAVYAATKAFVLAFTQALWAELNGTGVRILAVCPGPTATKFFDVAGSDMTVMKLRSVESVVKTTMRGLKHNRHTVIDGVGNSIGAFLGRTFPRSLVMPMVDRINR